LTLNRSKPHLRCKVAFRYSLSFCIVQSRSFCGGLEK
jgi:hypothetical protein